MNGNRIELNEIQLDWVELNWSNNISISFLKPNNRAGMLTCDWIQVPIQDIWLQLIPMAQYFLFQWAFCLTYLHQMHNTRLHYPQPPHHTGPPGLELSQATRYLFCIICQKTRLSLREMKDLVFLTQCTCLPTILPRENAFLLNMWKHLPTKWIKTELAYKFLCQI